MSRRFSSQWWKHHLRSNHLARWTLSHRVLYLMAATAETRIRPTTDLPFKLNAWEDLLHFEPTERWHDRDRFFKDARQKLDNGISCITLVQGGQLAFVDWVRTDTERASFGHVGQTVIFPKQVSTQFSGYVHPAHRGKGLFLEGMRHILDHVFENTDTEFAFAAVEHGHQIAFKGHLKVGFDTIAMLETRRILGTTQHKGAPLTSRFNLQAEQGSSDTWRLTKV